MSTPSVITSLADAASKIIPTLPRRSPEAILVARWLRCVRKSEVKGARSKRSEKRGASALAARQEAASMQWRAQEKRLRPLVEALVNRGGCIEVRDAQVVSPSDERVVDDATLPIFGDDGGE